ncbi:MAG TPA: type II toxin-antitoxin system VapC family toxin [Pseudonocardiaceae bacterium]|nr:type II toxin-antitoxin system VapC family toxin [Pseudonocardiaceae bacterium]
MIYFDSSALVKQVRAEAESIALREWLVDQGAVIGVTSTVARVEVVRAVAAGGQQAIARARAVLAELAQLQLTSGLLDSAADLTAPPRSLGAIHLASALRLGAGLRWFVAYDKRLLDAAEAVGLPIVAPGAS